MNIKQIDFLRIFKIAAAASIGCLLAVLFQLQTPTSAGIIAILSLQNTRRKPFLLSPDVFFFLSVHDCGYSGILSDGIPDSIHFCLSDFVCRYL